MSRAQTDRHFDSIVDFSGIEQFIDTQVKFYSSGMYVRLAFAVAVHVDPDVLLVDEVLAVGDEPFQRKCMDRIHSFQNDGRTIIIVSHSLDQIAELCDRAIVLEHGEVQVDGEPTTALRHLRADFEVTRQNERERERDSGVGQRASRAEIRQVRLGDDPIGEITRIKPGGAIVIHVTIDAIEPLTDWILGVGFDLPGGQIIYGTNIEAPGRHRCPTSTAKPGSRSASPRCGSARAITRSTPPIAEAQRRRDRPGQRSGEPSRSRPKDRASASCTPVPRFSSSDRRESTAD